MSPDQAAELARKLFIEAMLLSSPMLVAGCVISVLLSLFQTVTSLQDQTLTNVPRLFAVFGATVVCMPWFLRHLVTYTIRLWGDFHRYLE